MGSRRAARMAGYMPKKMPTRGGEAEAEREGPPRQRHREPGDEVHAEADGAAKHDPEHAADRRQHRRFRQELKQHFSPARAQRPAHADLARPLGHRNRHDRHHADAAHHQRNRRNHHQREERRLADLIPELQDRVLRDDVEVVRLVQPRPWRMRMMRSISAMRVLLRRRRRAAPPTI